MELTTIRELYKNSDSYMDQKVTIGGWVRSIRGSKAFGFIVVNDGTFFEPLQVVYHDKMDNFAEISKLNVGAAVIVTGTLVATPQAKQPFEIQADTVEVEGASAPDYPLQKKRHSFEYLRTIAHLRPRTNTFQAVFRVRSLTAYAIHKFFQERGFVYVHTPLITGSDCEGAGEMFRVTTLDMENLPHTDEGAVDFKKDFFGKPTSLTVSGQLEAECLLDAGLFARAEIEAHYRLTALTDALNGQGAQLGSAGDDGHGAHSHVAAVPRQTGAEADGQQALSGHHHKGGDAQRHHRQNDLLFQAHIVLAQAQDGLFAGKEAQDPHRAHGLTEHGGNGSAPHAQPQTKDQDGVENNVDDRTDDGGKHTGLGKALRGDKGVHAQADHDKDSAQGVGGQIAVRIGEGGAAGAEEVEDGLAEQEDEGSEYHAQPQQQGKGVALDPLGLFVVPLAPADGAQRRAAGAAQVGKADDDGDDRQHQPHAGEGQTSHTGQASDIHPVHNIIEDIHQLSRRHGQGHPGDGPGHAALCKIIFCFRHGSASFPV